MLSGGHEQIPLLNSSAVILQNPIVIRQWKAATNHERLRTTGQIQQSREFKTVFCCWNFCLVFKYAMYLNIPSYIDLIFKHAFRLAKVLLLSRCQTQVFLAVTGLWGPGKVNFLASKIFSNVVVTSHSSCVFLYSFSSANISSVRFVLHLQDWWCVDKRETSFPVNKVTDLLAVIFVAFNYEK